jgi:hypothetical protein
MTTWGCTPLCRGFDRHGGFYNAYNDYFTYEVGPGLDLRLDFAPDNATAIKRPYSSDLYADRAIDWITGAVGAGAKNSFGYLAFQAIHAPQEAPAELVNSGFCADSIPASAPVRRIACGQMRSVDANVARVVAAYKALGIWDSTLVIFTACVRAQTSAMSYPSRARGLTSYPLRAILSPCRPLPRHHRHQFPFAGTMAQTRKFMNECATNKHPNTQP